MDKKLIKQFSLVVLNETFFFVSKSDVFEANVFNRCFRLVRVENEMGQVKLHCVEELKVHHSTSFPWLFRRRETKRGLQWA